MSAINNMAGSHHYIPQFILRNFVNDNQKLHCFRKESGSRFMASPQNVFAENNLYTDIKEIQLSQFEGSLSPVVNKIIKESQTFADIVLSSSEEELLQKFFDIQIIRHPSMRDLIHTHFGTIDLQQEIEKQSNRPMNSAERELFYDLSNADRVFTSTIDSSENNPGSFLNVLKQRRVGIVRLMQTAGELVIGDMPFILFSSRNRCINSMSPGDWLLFPISWNVGIIWGLEDSDEKLRTFDDSRWASDINLKIFHQSKIIAGRSENVICSVLNLSER